MAGARQEDRVVVTADTDFGTLLALSGMARPSVLLLRRPGRCLEQRAAAAADAIAAVEDALEEDALVVVEPHRIRVRELPTGGR
jgi:predicted nuclease of predicted toxin-antitoxin system